MSSFMDSLTKFESLCEYLQYESNKHSNEFTWYINEGKERVSSKNVVQIVNKQLRQSLQKQAQTNIKTLNKNIKNIQANIEETINRQQTREEGVVNRRQSVLHNLEEQLNKALVNRDKLENIDKYLQGDNPHHSSSFPEIPDKFENKFIALVERSCGHGWEWLVLLVLVRKLKAKDFSERIIDFSKEAIPLDVKRGSEPLYLYYRPKTSVPLLQIDNKKQKSLKSKPDFILTKSAQSPYTSTRNANSIDTIIECKSTNFRSKDFFKFWGQARGLKASTAILLCFQEHVPTSDADYQKERIIPIFQEDVPNKSQQPTTDDYIFLDITDDGLHISAMRTITPIKDRLRFECTPWITAFVQQLDLT